MNKAIYAEDVRDIAIAALELIRNRLEEYNITLTDDQEDQLYIPVVEALEDIAGHPDYRSYN